MTKPPIDLYCYYLFLQAESSEDVLDFWLDVQQHENLCRAYFKDVIKQGLDLHHIWPGYIDYVREYGSIYERIVGIEMRDEGEGGEEEEKDQVLLESGNIAKEWRGGLQSGHAETLHLEEEEGEVQQQRQLGYSGNSSSAFTRDGRLSVDPRGVETPSPQLRSTTPTYPLSPTLRALYPHDATEQGEFIDRPSSRASRRPRPSQPTQPYIPRSEAINRTDLIASAERIFSRYLLPGSPKEIYLPPHLRLPEFPLSSSTLPSVHHPSYDYESRSQSRIPDMFVQQKKFIYDQMARESFPRFIRLKVWGNLTGTSGLMRLVGGLFVLWVGLSVGLSFIFVDVQPRSTRLWVRSFFLFLFLSWSRRL